MQLSIYTTNTRWQLSNSWLHINHITLKAGEPWGTNPQALHFGHLLMQQTKEACYHTGPVGPWHFPFEVYCTLRTVDTFNMQLELLFSTEWNTYITAIFLKMHAFIGTPHVVMSWPRSCLDMRIYMNHDAWFIFPTIHSSYITFQRSNNQVSITTHFSSSLDNSVLID